MASKVPVKSFSSITKLAIIGVIVFVLGAVLFRFTTLGSTLANLTLATQPALEEGLILHWTFDAEDFDASQTSAEVRDRSGNGNHGDLFGQ